MEYFKQEASSYRILYVQAHGDEIHWDDQHLPMCCPHFAMWLQSCVGPAVYYPQEDLALLV